MDWIIEEEDTIFVIELFKTLENFNSNADGRHCGEINIFKHDESKATIQV